MHNLYENISLTNVNIYIYRIIWGGFYRVLGGLLSGWLLSGWLLSVPQQCITKSNPLVSTTNSMDINDFAFQL